MLTVISRSIKTGAAMSSLLNVTASFRYVRPPSRIFSSSISSLLIRVDPSQSQHRFERHVSTISGSAVTTRSAILTNASSAFYESRRFKGHSHWQNIAKTKMAHDIAKGNVTSRLVMKIGKCVRKTKETNPRFNKDLANLLEECAANNISKDTIQRAIDRAMKGPPVQTHTYCICGRSGIYLVAEVETAEKTKIRNKIYNLCAKIGDFGIADQLQGFQETGIVKVFKDSTAAKQTTADSVSETAQVKAAPPLTLSDAETLAIELECEEVQEVEAAGETASLFEFTCAPESVDNVASGLRSRGYVVQSADSEFVPYPALVKVTPQLQQSVRALCQKLQDNIEGLGRIFDNVQWEDDEEEED